MAICQAINKSNWNNCNFKATNGKYCNKHKDYFSTDKYGTNGLTITLGNQAENHVGMQIIGKPCMNGYTLSDFNTIIADLTKKGIITKLYDLRTGLQGLSEYLTSTEAYLLVIKNGVTHLLKGTNKTEEDLYQEHINLKWDTHALMKGSVKNKKARYNLCYSEESQEPDYASGKGRIVAFGELPLLNTIRQRLPEFFGEKANELVAESNLYYNINYNGIGFHGDTERRIVIAIRAGNEFPFRYQWYLNSEAIGTHIDVKLQAGDIYIMSEKAVGSDWKTRKIPTLRHAAGCDDYIK